MSRANPQLLRLNILHIPEIPTESARCSAVYQRCADPEIVSPRQSMCTDPRLRPQQSKLLSPQSVRVRVRGSSVIHQVLDMYSLLDKITQVTAV